MQSQILVLSDIHAGSSYGLLPPSFQDREGTIHEQLPGQQYLWKCFTNMLDKVQKRPISYIVVNGDLLDGMHPKEKEPKIRLHNIADQREAAYKILEEVKNRFPSAKWFFTSGTPYHEGEDEVAQVNYLLTGNKGKTLRTLPLHIGKVFVRFHHEVGFSSGFLRASGIERELVSSKLASINHSWDLPDAEIRSHCHYFLYVGGKKVMGLVTPGWQLQTDFTTKRTPTQIPDIGAVVLSCDDTLKEYSMCPVGFTEYLYDHPEQEGVYVEEESAPVSEEQ